MHCFVPDIVSGAINWCLGFSTLYGLVCIYLVFKKDGRRELKENNTYFFCGVGVTVILLMFLHGLRVPTMLDMHGDYLECSQCKATIEEIKCPKCGKAYSANPITDLPWEYAERDSN